MAGWASGFNPLVALSASVLWAGSAVGAEPQPMVECLGTQRRCTTTRPCGLDQAPICRVIREGTSTVRGITYPAVSTFSYRGWCQTFRPVTGEGPKAGPWADCMAAPCQLDPRNPDRPLKCQCRVETGPFVGIDGSCGSPPGEVMSTIDRRLWNFQTGAFAVPVPGNAFVNQGGCRFLRSDP